MGKTSRMADASIDLDAWIDELCDSFEKRFNESVVSSVESFTQEFTEELPNRLLQELIQLEVDLRLNKDEHVFLSEYLERFPDLSGEVVSAWNGIVALRSDLVGLMSEQCFHMQVNFGNPSLGITTIASLPREIGPYEDLEIIGSGAFGFVFSSKDRGSALSVAIKFPRPKSVYAADLVEQICSESELARQLEHPNIIPSYGVEKYGEYIFIKQKLLEGTFLSDLIELGCTEKAAVNFMILVANAISYAHENGVYHRDLKPKNIGIDSDGSPVVMDFGLAINRHTQHEREGEMCGTPHYVSPELVEGRSDFIDGRSDLWSLGVILYEMLTQRRPFDSPNRAALFSEICNRPAPAIREIKPSIDPDLEKICLRCLEKNVEQRFLTVADFATALMEWRQTNGSSSEERRYQKIDPKGFQSFTVKDHESFIRLLPGERDVEGKPVSIRIWCERLENTMPELALPACIIYGTSGSGKSSFVRAGIIPSLNQRIVSAIYVACQSGHIEERIVDAIKMRMEGVRSQKNLVKIIQTIQRESPNTESKKKLVVILDQFELWLHNGVNKNNLLTKAIQSANGVDVQFLLIVRDDYWIAISRLMRQIECPIDDRMNIGLVDQFDKKHARFVLGEYGRAFGTLPVGRLSPQQEKFIDLAVNLLAADGFVICIRLVLFAEFFRNRDWNLSSFRRFGSIDGIAEAFFQEVFELSESKPQHKWKLVTIERILQTLVPSKGMQIRENVISYSDLAKAAGFDPIDEEYKCALNFLEHDLKIIVTSDIEQLVLQSQCSSGISQKYLSLGANGDPSVPKEQCYQLAHDFLIRPIRNWLSRRTKATWRGRAELSLNEHFELWQLSPRREQLLPALKLIWIWLSVNRANLTDEKREYIKKSSRIVWYQGAFWTLIVFSLVTVVGYFIHQSNKSRAIATLDRYYADAPELISHNIEQLKVNKTEVFSRLRNDLKSKLLSKRFRATLAFIQLHSCSNQLLESFVSDYCQLTNHRLIRESLRELCFNSKQLLPIMRRKIESNNVELEAKVRLIATLVYLGEFSFANHHFDNAKDPTIACLVCDEIVRIFPDLTALCDAEQLKNSNTQFRFASVIFSANEKEPQLITNSVREFWQSIIDCELAQPSDAGIYSICEAINRMWNDDSSHQNGTLIQLESLHGNWFVRMPSGAVSHFISVEPNEFVRAPSIPFVASPFLGQGEYFEAKSFAKIQNAFWICSKELTFRDAKEFLVLDENKKIRAEMENRYDLLKAANFDIDLPLEFISFHDAQRLVNWLNNQNCIDPSYMFDFANSDEWEFVCRAGSTTVNYWGSNASEDLKQDYAVIAQSLSELDHNKASSLRRPGSKLPNRFGCWDMIGNVAELTKKTAREYAMDSSERQEIAFARGGNAVTPRSCWSSYVFAIPSDRPHAYQGIRLVIRRKKSN
jgi:serine/threonine protein kinase